MLQIHLSDFFSTEKKSINELIDEKTDKLKKFSDGIISVHITLAPEKKGRNFTPVIAKGEVHLKGLPVIFKQQKDEDWTLAVTTLFLSLEDAIKTSQKKTPKKYCPQTERQIDQNIKYLRLSDKDTSPEEMRERAVHFLSHGWAATEEMAQGKPGKKSHGHLF